MQELLGKETEDMVRNCYNSIVEISKKVESENPGEFEHRPLQCYMAAKAVCNESL